MNKAYTSAFEKAFSKASKLIKNPAGISALLINVGKKVVSGKSSIKDIKKDLLLLVRLIKRWSKGEYKDVSKKTILSIIATLLYFVNPIDMIPDILPIIGFADDTAILLYILNLVGHEIDSFKEWERLETVNKVTKEL
jgi:uncharacterized membrane protein YkvA (DUF1232 family)